MRLRRLPAPFLPEFGPAHAVMAVAVLLLGLFLYAAAQTAAKGYQLRQSERALAAEVETLKRDRTDLEGLKAYVASDEYIESVARTRFGLVRPGEVAVVVEAPAAAVPPSAPGGRWWRSVFGR